MGLRRIIFIVIGLLLISTGLGLFYKQKINTLTLVWPIEKPQIVDVRDNNSIRFYPGVYDTLFRYNEVMELETRLAESWTQTFGADKTTWTFKPVKDVTFSDGSIVETSDIIASLDFVPGIKCSPDNFNIVCVTSLSSEVFTRNISTTPIVKSVNGKYIGTGDYILSGESDDSIMIQKSSGKGTFRNLFRPEFVIVKFVSFKETFKNVMDAKEPDIIFDALNIEDNYLGYSRVSVPSLEMFFILPKAASDKSVFGRNQVRGYLKSSITNAIKTKDNEDNLNITNRFFPSFLVSNVKTIDDIQAGETKLPSNIILKNLTGLDTLALYLKSVLKGISDVKVYSLGKTDLITDLNNKFTGDELLLLGWNFETASVFSFIKDIIVPVCETWPNPIESENCLKSARDIVEYR